MLSDSIRNAQMGYLILIAHDEDAFERLDAQRLQPALRYVHQGRLGVQHSLHWGAEKARFWATQLSYKPALTSSGPWLRRAAQCRGMHARPDR